MAKKLIIIIVIIYMILFSFCDKDNNQLVENNDKETKSSTFKPFSVIDLKEREITIERKINRVIPTYTPAKYFVLGLKAYDKMVAVGKYGNDTLFSKIYPKYSELPRVEHGHGNINIEEMVANKPDLLILYPTKDCYDVASSLAIFNIPSVIIDPETIDKIKLTIKLLGKLLEVEQQSELLLSYYDSLISEIANKTKDNEKPKVYYADGELLKTISGEMLQSEMIEKASGKCATKELKGWKQIISTEQLIQWNPDYIILSSYSKVDNGWDMLNNPQLQEINAIKNKQVYSFPSNIDNWDYPSPNTILGIYWLAFILHKDSITEQELVNKINQFYKDIYGKTFKELEGTMYTENIKSFDSLTGATSRN